MPRPVLDKAYHVWNSFRALWRGGLASGIPKVPPVRLDAIAASSTHLRTILINLTILIVLLIVGPVIGKQFWRNQVLIEPIAVPAALQRTGLTPEVAASRLWDGLAKVQVAAGTSKTGITAIPDSEKVDFSIPDAGISIDSLIHYVRDYFNVYETRITGEIRCATEACEPRDTTIRLRVVRNDVQVLPLEPRGEMTEEEYFRTAASEIMGVLDPFTAIAAEASTRPEKARVRAKRLILEGHPDAKWAHNLLGNLSTDRGEFDVALTYYQAALSIDPNFVPALNNLGENLRHSGDLKGARTAFVRAQALEPGNPFTADGLAELASLDGKTDQAIEYLLTAAKADPLSSRHLLKAGLLEIGAGRLDKAREYFLAALESDPTNVDVLQIATALIADDYSLAERLYRDAADLAPENADLQASHANRLYYMQKFSESLERSDKAIKLDRRNPRYLRDKGRTLLALQRYDDALDAVEGALALSGADADLWGDKGRILLLLERKADALEAYEAAIEHAPPDDLALPLYRQMAQTLITEIGVVGTASARTANWFPAWG